MPPTLTKADVDRIAGEVRNWGRWGADDERGALNLITDEKRNAALASVRGARVVSCALPLPVRPSPSNHLPVAHHMLQAGDATPACSM